MSREIELSPPKGKEVSDKVMLMKSSLERRMQAIEADNKNLRQFIRVMLERQQITIDIYKKNYLAQEALMADIRK